MITEGRVIEAGWLVCFVLDLTTFVRQHFSLYRARIPEKVGARGWGGGGGEKKCDRRKKRFSNSIPPTPSAITVGPAPLLSKVVGRSGTLFHSTPSPDPTTTDYRGRIREKGRGSRFNE